MIGLGSKVPYSGSAIGYFCNPNFYGITVNDAVHVENGADNSFSWWNGPYGGYADSGFERSFDSSALSSPWFYQSEVDTAATNWNGGDSYGPGYNFANWHSDAATDDEGFLWTPFLRVTTSHLTFDSHDFAMSQIGAFESDWTRDYHQDVLAVSFSTPWWSQSLYDVHTSLSETSHQSGPGFEEVHQSSQADHVMVAFSEGVAGFTEQQMSEHQNFTLDKVVTGPNTSEHSHFDANSASESITVSPFGEADARGTWHAESDHFAFFGPGSGFVEDNSSYQSLLVTHDQHEMPVPVPPVLADHGFFVV